MQLALRQFIEGDAFNYALNEQAIARDRTVVDCMADRSLPLDERVKVLMGWLGSYSVLMGFNAAQRIQVTRNVLAYADGISGAKVSG